MGLLSRLETENRSRSAESPTTSLSNPADWLFEAMGGRAAASGVRITPRNARSIATVYACVEVLTETVGMLPLGMYQRTGENARAPDPDYPTHRVINRIANPVMDAMTYWETVVGHMALWGNHYGEIARNQRGDVVEIWPLDPSNVRVERVGTEKQYHVIFDTGRAATLNQDQVFHVMGTGHDGLVGESRVTYARESMGLASAAEQYGARFFGNDASPGGVLEYPGRLKDDAFDRLKKSWNDAHQGIPQAHKVAILEGGTTWKQTGMPNQDAQFLESRRFQREEIASWFRMPPHKVGIMDKATFSNIEEQSREFLTDTLMWWLVKIETAILTQLVPEGDQNRVFPKFSVNAILRGNIESRYKAYAVGRQWGWLSANDVLALEDHNPIGPEGDVYLTPLNMLPADDADAQAQARALMAGIGGDPRRLLPVDRGNGTADHELDPEPDPMTWDVVRDLAVVDIRRALRREVRQVQRLATKHLTDGNRPAFRDALAGMYAKHAPTVANDVAPTIDAMWRWQALALDVDGIDASHFAVDFANRMCRDGIAAIYTAVDGADDQNARDAVLATVHGWADDRAPAAAAALVDELVTMGKDPTP